MLKGTILLLALAFSGSLFAASYSTYDCASSGSGSKTIDSFTIVKMDQGPDATVEFHPVGAGKGFDLSPTSSGDRCDRLHEPVSVAPNGTAEYCPAANPQEFNNAIFPDPNEPAFVSAFFLSQGLLQDKGSGYVEIEFRYGSGSGASMHTRKYDCTLN